MWRAFERLCCLTGALGFNNSHRHCRVRELGGMFDFRHMATSSLSSACRSAIRIHISWTLTPEPSPRQTEAQHETNVNYGLALLMYDPIDILFGPELATSDGRRVRVFLRKPHQGWVRRREPTKAPIVYNVTGNIEWC
jgi:hypothetical protein